MRWLVVGLLSLATMGCGSPSIPNQPNIVLILIDTLRADHVGAYGYPRPTTPGLDELASHGTRWIHAQSTSSWTRPAIGSLFTSRLPSEHGAVTADRPLPDEAVTLAELLRSAGYRTIGISANFAHVSKETGFAQGFDEFTAISIDVDPSSTDYLWAGRDAKGELHKIRDASAAELNTVVFRNLPSREQEPFFLYVHYTDPHSGYTPPLDLRKRFVRNPEVDRASPAATGEYVNAAATKRIILSPLALDRLIDLYDAEVASADRGAGRLLQEIKLRGLDRNTVYVVVADHGEEFGDHGGFFHGLTLYSECLSIPLIITDSRTDRGGVARDEPVDLMDVPTTLLAMAGVPISGGMRGRDLFSVSPDLPARDLLAELHEDAVTEKFFGPRKHRFSLTRWPWKLIGHRDGAQEWFDEEHDPAERSRVTADALPQSSAAMRREAASQLHLSDSASKGKPRDLTPEEHERLRALGYVE